jgi:putative ABC transport system permease protein
VNTWSLARKILLHDRVKFLVAAAGVSISVTLVLVQIGLYRGFMESMSLPIDHSAADIWVASKGTDNFDFARPMDERSFYRISSIDGVARAERIIIAFSQVMLPSGGGQSVEVIGIEEPTGELLRPWNVINGDASRTSDYDGVVVDTSELDRLGVQDVGDRREIGGLRARVVAMTTGIRNFTTTPYVFTNLESARSYARMKKEQVTYVLARVAPGFDVEAVRASIANLPHVEAFTKAEFSKRARDYWDKRTGVGTGFFLTAIMGVVVGLVVVGQILYNGTLEHVREYGTLKAMGATNASVVWVIMCQALISAVVGYVVGAILALIARRIVTAVFLKITISSDLLVSTALLTVVMCCSAAMLSVLKVLRLDPASVFKG